MSNPIPSVGATGASLGSSSPLTNNEMEDFFRGLQSYSLLWKNESDRPSTLYGIIPLAGFPLEDEVPPDVCSKLGDPNVIQAARTFLASTKDINIFPLVPDTYQIISDEISSSAIASKLTSIPDSIKDVLKDGKLSMEEVGNLTPAQLKDLNAYASTLIPRNQVSNTLEGFAVAQGSFIATQAVYDRTLGTWLEKNVGRMVCRGDRPSLERFNNAQARPTYPSLWTKGGWSGRANLRYTADFGKDLAVMGSIFGAYSLKNEIVYQVVGDTGLYSGTNLSTSAAMDMGILALFDLARLNRFGQYTRLNPGNCGPNKNLNSVKEPTAEAPAPSTVAAAEAPEISVAALSENAVRAIGLGALTVVATGVMVGLFLSPGPEEGFTVPATVASATAWLEAITALRISLAYYFGLAAPAVPVLVTATR